MTPGDHTTPSKWAVFSAVGLSYFITVMAFTVSLLALREIAEDFDITLRVVGWVVIIESLIIAALLLPMGGLSDVLGRHRTLRAGLALFALGLILSGLSPSFALLMAARVVTAVGNTLVQSVSTGILVGAFPSEERGLALGAQTTAVASGAALGPLLGGLLLSQLGWQTLYLLLAVPAACTYFVVRWVLALEPRNSTTSNFDRTGAVLSAASIMLLVFTINDPFEFGFTSPATIASAVIAAVLLLLFVQAELRHDAPMLDVRLFQIPDFRRAVSIRIVAFIASSSIMFLIPVYLLSVRNLGTGATGVIFALFAVGMVVGAQMSGRMYDRLGARLPMTIGLGIQCAVLILLSQVSETSALAFVAVASAGNGLAQGLWNVPANSIMMGAMPKKSLGVGGAFTNVTRTVGSVAGQAGATAIVAGVMVSRDFDIPLGDVGDTPGAGSAFVAGWQLNYIIGIGVSMAALVLAALSSTGTSKPAGQTA